MKSILAGIIISVSGFIYLNIDGYLGAFLFSIGLLTILYFKLELFTGKAGLFVDRKIHFLDLLTIWCGNYIGAFLGGVFFAGSGKVIAQTSAAAIIDTRIGNLWYENVILGILCGVLMYIAVSHYETKPWVTVMCVMAFILSGMNHSIADMFYYNFSDNATWQGMFTILCTTTGNFIGCNLIPGL